MSMLLLAVAVASTAATAQAIRVPEIQAPIATGFGSYTPYIVPKYQPAVGLSEPSVAADFSNVATLGGDFPWKNFFTAGERGILQRENLVARPEALGSFAQAYSRALMTTDVGSFITVDALMQGLRVTADEALRSMERDYTAPTLTSVLADLSRSLSAQLDAERNPSLANSFLRLLAYTQTAQALLNPSAPVDGRVREMVNGELEKIRSASGMASSSVFPNRRIDYSRFAPTGHYRLNNDFSDYYRAKKWLGSIGFDLRSADGSVDLADARMALLLARSMELLASSGDFRDRYQSVVEPLAFFSGRTDADVTWDMIAGAMRGYYGRLGMSGTSVLADDADLKVFVDYAQAQLPTELTGMGAYTFRLMSQDADASQALADQLRRSNGGSYGVALMGGIGSDRAAQIQSGKYDAVRTFLGAGSGRMPAENWVQDLDHAILYTMRPMLTGERTDSYPKFMRGDTWRDRELGSSLGAWAAFQHDVATMPMQKAASTAVSFGRRTEGDLRTEGYVEPNPEAWARVASLAAYLRNGLSARNANMLGNRMIIDKLRDIESASSELMRIAALELANKDLSDAQFKLIASMGDRIAAYESFTDKSLQGEGSPVVAGASQGGTANGNPIAIYVIVPRNDAVGGLMLTRGAVYSYFETNSSDDNWRRTITTPGSDVSAMSWMKSYLSTDRPLAQDARKFQGVSASLQSVVAAAPTIPTRKSAVSNVQLNLESNVVRRSSGELWVTVRAPQMDGTDIILIVANSAGQTVYQSYALRIENGERYDMVPTSDLQSGQYFIRVSDLLDHTLASGRFLVVR
jgi:hypothetical protein